MLRRLIAATALAVCAFGDARASPEYITAGELALTPPFCQDVQTINGWTRIARESPRAPYWVSLMGETFWGMHHYCWALISLQRARAAGVEPRVRNYLIHTAIDDFYFVVKIAPSGFVMLPEIYFRIGDAHAALNEPGPAMDAYRKSRSLKPDYWPPYVSQAKLLEKVGLKAEARKTLEEGLRVMPEEPALRAPYQRLGGRLSELAPAVAASSSPTNPSAEPAPAKTASAPQ